MGYLKFFKHLCMQDEPPDVFFKKNVSLNSQENICVRAYF